MAQQLLADAAEAIAAIGAGNPRLEAELLLARALGRSRVFLMTHPEHEPSPEACARFRDLLDRRRSSEPLQYVLGDAAFRHLTLRVRPGVLIPRAETEVLVDHAWAALQRWRARHPEAAGPSAEGHGVARATDAGPHAPGHRDARDAGPGPPAQGHRDMGDAGTRPHAGSGGRSPRPWVIDVGVGSGAIVLALMHEALVASPGGLWFRPLGIDISAIPLSITAENADMNTLPHPHLALADLLAAVRADAPVAGIVSNPPYIATGEMPELPAEIREYEPHEALHAGPDGLGAIRILLDQARPFIERGAFLCFEIGGLQADGVRRELAARGMLELSCIYPDLAGRPRVVLVEAGA
jgi:release factor glutamine methyltransferase